jgi:hypothetical protein
MSIDLRAWCGTSLPNPIEDDAEPRDLNVPNPASINLCESGRHSRHKRRRQTARAPLRRLTQRARGSKGRNDLSGSRSLRWSQRSSGCSHLWSQAPGGMRRKGSPGCRASTVASSTTVARPLGRNRGAASQYSQRARGSRPLPRFHGRRRVPPSCPARNQGSKPGATSLSRGICASPWHRARVARTKPGCCGGVPMMRCVQPSPTLKPLSTCRPTRSSTGSRAPGPMSASAS